MNMKRCIVDYFYKTLILFICFYFIEEKAKSTQYMHTFDEYRAVPPTYGI